jgi:hypothetical protein
LIHEIIGVTNETLCIIFSKTGVGSLTEDSIDSSEKDNDASEEEIEADLVITEEDEVPKVTHVARPQLFLSPSPSPYSSDSSSDLDSDSDLDDAEDGQKAMMVKPVKLGESHQGIGESTVKPCKSVPTQTDVYNVTVVYDGMQLVCFYVRVSNPISAKIVSRVRIAKPNNPVAC